MIFILKEQVMNGTVTMSVIVTGIEAPSFKEAVEKIKNLPTFSNATVIADTEDRFDYSMPNLIGYLEAEPLNVI